MLIIDAHSHLWLNQDAAVGGGRVRTLDGDNRSRSEFFGEIRQMLPPFMIDGRNTAEVFISNMDYAQVGAAVVVQELIDGNQNEYLSQVASRYPQRLFCMGMASTPKEVDELHAANFKGVAIAGHRIDYPLTQLLPMLHRMEALGMVLSVCLHEDNHQLEEMEEIIRECPDLKIAIGHFGMVTTPGWLGQVHLARHPNVMIETGGITWLFNDEFYPYPSAMKAIRTAADEIGIDKIMWGSDYPRTITAITYRMSYDFIIKSDLLSEDEKRLLLGENARRFYGFTELPELPYIKNMSE